MPERDGIERAIRLADLEPRSFPRFDFIENAIVNVLQGRIDNFGEAIAVLADDIHAGFDSGGLRGSKQPCRPGAKLRIQLVQRVQQEQIAKMENARSRFTKVQIVTTPMSIRAASVKERAPTVSLFRHHIGVRRWGLARRTEMFGINVVLAAVAENLLAKRIFSDEAGSHQRERCAGIGEIYQNVVRRTAGALGLATDISELLRLRIDVNNFYLVNDPVPTGEQTAAAVSIRAFHGAKSRGAVRF